MSRDTEDKKDLKNYPASLGKDILDGYISILQTSLKNPKSIAKEPFSLLSDLGSILTGKSIAQPQKGDRRFKDETWENNPVYKGIMQTYLSLSDRADSHLSNLGLDDKNESRAKFVSGSILSSMSPSNSLLGNPKALKKSYETGGASLFQGSKNFIDDLINNGGMPSLVDKSAFKLGENLATTPGKVVYRTNMLELIQYTSQTKQVHSVPLLMVPPQINKYYVYDIAPERSFIEYIVSQGFQVFAVSWKNPGPDERAWDFASYVKALEGASEVVSKITSSDKINTIGACSGGMTTATLLAYLAAKEIDRMNSFTLMVSVLDSGAAEDTSLGLFLHREILELAKANSGNSGVLKGEDLAKIFAHLRPNDLIWPYWVNNYLMGEKPPEFDILFWNSDTTNLPAALHSDFLGFFEDNPFIESGKISIEGTPIDLKNITCDTYILAGSTDHITPWQACYKTMQLLGGNSEFILSSSGHVQAIVNPTSNPKAEFYTSEERCDDSEEFLQKAVRNEGSWWSHWSVWLRERSGKKKAAPKKLGHADYPVLCDSPGTYACDK